MTTKDTLHNLLIASGWTRVDGVDGDRYIKPGHGRPSFDVLFPKLELLEALKAQMGEEQLRETGWYWDESTSGWRYPEQDADENDKHHWPSVPQAMMQQPMRGLAPEQMQRIS